MSQLEALCEKLGITAESQYGGAEVPEGWQPGTHPYRVTLTRRTAGGGRRQLTVDFFMGPASTREPTAADVLACLVIDANAGEQSFEEFCSDLGYDSDSRKAERIHAACVRMAPRLRRFLGEHFDNVAGAEH